MMRFCTITPFAILGPLAVIVAVALAVNPVAAQTTSGSFGGLSENADEPIDIQSDVLTVYDAKKLALFVGNVRAVQGTTTLRAAELDVHYTGDAKKFAGQSEDEAPAPPPAAAAQTAQSAAGSPQGAESQIKKIEARGNVVITSEDDQTTTSDWVLYDVPAQLVTVGGNVVLSQQQNVLKGDRLVIDLVTGQSRFVNTGTATSATGTGDGRIRALFLPNGPVEPKKSKRGKKSGEQDLLLAPSGEPAAGGQPVPQGGGVTGPGQPVGQYP